MAKLTEEMKQAVLDDDRKKAPSILDATGGGWKKTDALRKAYKTGAHRAARRFRKKFKEALESGTNHEEDLEWLARQWARNSIEFFRHKHEQAGFGYNLQPAGSRPSELRQELTDQQEEWARRAHKLGHAIPDIAERMEVPRHLVEELLGDD